VTHEVATPLVTRQGSQYYLNIDWFLSSATGHHSYSVVLTEPMMRQPAISIVLVGYRDEGSLISKAREALRSSYSNLSVVAVVNGARGPLAAEAHDNRLEIHSTHSNLGFAGGCNKGINIALSRGADFVFLLNNDASVKGECISGMVKRMLDEPKIGVLCPVIVAEGSHLVESAGDRANNWIGLTLHNASGRRIAEVWGSHPRVDFAPGVALMVRSDALRTVGLLDARYFMYIEDVDLSIRMKRAGYQVSCATDAWVSHASSSTSGKYPGLKQYYMMRNRLLLYWLLRMRARLVAVAFTTPWVLLLRIIRLLPRLKAGELRGLFLGVIDGFKLSYGPSRRREYSPP
jgi:GT2 family glycosyltransferase